MLKALVRQFSVHTEDTLNHIIVPVLLLSGRADALTSPSEAEQLKVASQYSVELLKWMIIS
jgi:hypothetical protein